MVRPDVVAHLYLHGRRVDRAKDRLGAGGANRTEAVRGR
jgi:hypothetical protein